jgi:hypothetical protein
VARDLVDSGLGTSAFTTSRGARRNREIASRDRSHRDGAEDDTWHRASAFGVLKVERITGSHMPISR